MLHGPYLSYYPGGTTQIKGAYFDDLKDGDWIYYDEDGNLETRISYDRGEVKNPEALEEKYEGFIKRLEENAGNFPDPAKGDLQ
jgi:antitoxin component YwqK of YwqJK toxin-antitoxin module